MTQSMPRTVERRVTVIRSLRGGAEPRPARRLNARQALPFSASRRMVDRGAAPVLLRRIDGADGLTTLCNSLEG